MISIFAKPPYFLDDINNHGKLILRRISSRIRGEEIANYLGAKLNPTEGYEKDICIYVKAYALHRMKDGDYIDLLDDLYATEQIKDRPKINVIAMSTPHKEYLSRILKNKITYIPHHHVNFEKFKRFRKKITTCGYVGSGSGYEINVNKKLAKLLAAIGLKFIPLYNYSSRKNIVTYYKKIDLQIVGGFNHLNVPYYHQTKIVNAMSFGIPTIASRRLGYQDIEGYYIAAGNLDELISAAKKMKDPEEYYKWPKKIIAESEKYHINEIAKLYKKLK